VHKLNFESAKIRADAIRIEAKGKMDAASLEGDLYAKYPRLYEFKIAEIRSKGLQKTNFTVVSEEFAEMFSVMGPTLFPSKAPPLRIGGTPFVTDPST